MAGDLHILVDEHAAGQRLDAFLGAQEHAPSRSACARLIDAGAVDVNGETCTMRGKKLRPGDIVTTPDIPDLEFEVIARADQ